VLKSAAVAAFGLSQQVAGTKLWSVQAVRRAASCANDKIGVASMDKSFMMAKPSTGSNGPLSSRTRTRAFDAFLICVGVAVTAYILITTAIIINNAFSRLPLEDHWSLWQLYLTHGKYSAFLFTPHNEHRIAVPRLFLMIDHYLFHARNLFPLICSLLVQATTGVWLYRMACRTGEARRVSRLLLGCTIFSALFSAQQFPNLVQGIQIQFTMLYCASCGSFLALLRAAERWEEHGHPELWFATCCTSALVATYSLANGLLCWPVLLLLALWLRLPFRYALALFVDMVLVTAFYLWGYHTPPQHSSPIETLTNHFPGVLIRAATFLGSPSDAIYAIMSGPAGLHSDNSRIALSAAFGIVGMIAAVWGVILLWRRRAHYTKGHAALAHVGLFVVLTAGLVGLGRANFPLIAAMDPRYKTHALVFWLAVGAFYWPFLENRLAVLSAGWRQVAFSGVVLWMIVGLAARQPFWIQYSKDDNSAISQIQAAIVSDVFDAPIWQKSFPPSGSAIFGPADYLRQNRLSIFTESWTAWTGKPVESLFTMDHAASCIGFFDSATPVASSIRPGWRVSGWAWDRLRQTGPGTVILVDAAQRIAGVVRNTVERGDVHQVIPEVQSSRVGWSGYVAGSEPKTLIAYLLERDGHSLCALGGPLTPAPVGQKGTPAE
jgi:hypothetical protein